LGQTILILLADSWAGLIWRVDLLADGKPKPSVWLEHDSMGDLAKLYYQRIQLPGINGIQYSRETLLSLLHRFGKTTLHAGES
jgi:hypothetical protein